MAQSEMQRAATALHEPMELRQADTPNGPYQRVAAGPYASKELAAAALGRAQSGGFADAWIFSESRNGASVAPTHPITSAADGVASIAAPIDDLDRRYRYSDDIGALDDLAPLEYDVGDYISKPVETLVEDPKLPTEIPAGYQLNQLFRDSASSGGG